MTSHRVLPAEMPNLGSEDLLRQCLAFYEYLDQNGIYIFGFYHDSWNGDEELTIDNFFL